MENVRGIRRTRVGNLHPKQVSGSIEGQGRVTVEEGVEASHGGSRRWDGLWSRLGVKEGIWTRRRRKRYKLVPRGLGTHLE